MDGSSLATDCNPVTKLDCGNAQTGIADDDQRFLLYFIIGTYFGPDLKEERQQKSVLQRIAEGIPPYTSDQLAGSHVKMVEVERVYYYVLRKADQSAVVKLPLLHQFFHGNLPKNEQDPNANYPQFPDLFPSLHHPHSRFKNRYKIIENIVFINKPEISYIKPEDIDRFKRLSGLEDFVLERDAARLHTTPDTSALYSSSVQVAEPDAEMPSFRSSGKSKKSRRIEEVLAFSDPLQDVHAVPPFSSVPYNGTPMMYSSYVAPVPTDNSDPVEKVGPAMIYLPSLPAKTEWSNIVAATKSGFALTGSAAMGKVGPVIGLMDIGECEDSYLFRVSLPGVERDESKFPLKQMRNFVFEVDPQIFLQFTK